MGNGLGVKSVDFGELRKTGSEEFCSATGLTLTWDGLRDAAGVELVLTNSSKQVKRAHVYTVSIADIPSAPQWSWGSDIEVKPGKEERISYPVPMPGISSSDYRDYTGPLRYAISVRISESGSDEVLFKKVKYYDIPAKVAVDELEERKFNINEALEQLEKTTVLHNLHIGGNPKEGIESVKVSLLNFGEKIQYIGIDIRGMRKGTGYQTQYYYEVGPKEEMSVDIGSFIPKGWPPGIDYLRVKAVSIPEYVFKSRRARSHLIAEAWESILIGSFELHFRESE